MFVIVLILLLIPSTRYQPTINYRCQKPYNHLSRMNSILLQNSEIGLINASKIYKTFKIKFNDSGFRNFCRKDDFC